MSDNIHLSSGVDTILLKIHFAVATGAVGALIFPVKSNFFHLTVNLDCYFFSFSGFNSHNILMYVNFLSLRTCDFEMKFTVFVPFTVLIPRDNFPSSFAKDRSQNLLYGTLTRCLYSWATLYIWWVTALASLSCRNCAGNEEFETVFLLQIYCKLKLGPPMSTLGGCRGRTLFGGTGMSGIIMCGPEGYMCTLR